jgi:hypothetical protein
LWWLLGLNYSRSGKRPDQMPQMLLWLDAGPPITCLSSPQYDLAPSAAQPRGAREIFTPRIAAFLCAYRVPMPEQCGT